MKYCQFTTENHQVSLAYPVCMEDVNNLILKEGHSTSFTFTNNEVVLNLDCVETQIALGEMRDKKKSMDMTFGIANNDRSIQLMVLVELKLNHLNPNNVKRDFLEQKVLESISILSNSIDIYANFIFLFRADRKEEAKNRFFRMNPKIPNEYLVMDLEELHETFF